MKRYTVGARWYDLLSGERLVYRAGRVAGVQLLQPTRSGVVIDIGCGTGLSLPLLADAVGPEGLVIGVDSSPQMLAVAGRRMHAYSADRVQLLEADAASLDPGAVAAVLARAGRPPTVHAAFSSYAMSVVNDRHAVWRTLRAILAPGARLAIVDMQPPQGLAAVLRPAAALACALGGADLRARPWELVEAHCTDVTKRTLRGGHIVAAAGRLKATDDD